MAPNPTRLNARLDALYEKLPRLDCQGLCSDSCGPIEMSVAERQRIERTGVKMIPYDQMMATSCWVCPALSPLGLCTVYEIRPMLCRLWGIVESMPCPYDCVPEGGHLSDKVGFGLLAESLQVGGAPPGRAGIDRKIVEAIFENPQVRDSFREFVTEGMEAERGRLSAIRGKEKDGN